MSFLQATRRPKGICATSRASWVCEARRQRPSHGSLTQESFSLSWTFCRIFFGFPAEIQPTNRGLPPNEHAQGPLEQGFQTAFASEAWHFGRLGQLPLRLKNTGNSILKVGLVLLKMPPPTGALKNRLGEASTRFFRLHERDVSKSAD